jgi:hypothetical protein
MMDQVMSVAFGAAVATIVWWGVALWWMVRMSRRADNERAAMMRVISNIGRGVSEAVAHGRVLTDTTDPQTMERLRAAKRNATVEMGMLDPDEDID